MCGIVGIFDLQARREVDRALLERMNQTQVHRGPDGCGYHVEPGVGLGHRRLSIIDLAGGQQPLYNEDQTVVVTYNGEIYNFKTLTEELLILGHKFRTRCDTEVIVHAWEEWGEQCVERFNGMFAFAIWDRNKELLFLARDRLGIKPLYYGVTQDQQLLFSSELKALVCHPALPRAINLEAVEEYFTFGYVPDPKTIYKSVFKLPPGHVLTVARNSRFPEARQYWDVCFELHEMQDHRVVTDELLSRLKDCVSKRMIADVPLGAFLSGGVDSSAVVAMMAESSAEPINTCSISFGDPRYNESEHAEAVALKFGTAHHVEQVDQNDFSLIDRLIDIYDEPFADSSAIPTYRVCEVARRSVTVALSGDGGDENFAGYSRYRWHAYEERVRSLIPDVIRQPIFGVFGALYPEMGWAPKIFRAKSTLQALARNSIEGYLHSVSILPSNLREQLFAPAFKRKLQGYSAIEVFRTHIRRAPCEQFLSLVQYLDFKTYLPGDILTKIDRASMAHSLEVRVPLLDHEFVDWVSGLEPGSKLYRREGKYVFKKALETRLPDSILYRPKMGFAVPLSSWIRGPLREQVRKQLLDSELCDSGIFNRRFLSYMLDQHHKGLRDFSAPIWALLMFAGFHKKMGIG